MNATINHKQRMLVVASPFVIILLGYLTASVFSGLMDGWAWVPLALVYWGATGWCIYAFKGNKRIRDWLQKPKPSKGSLIASLALGMFPLSILAMNYKLFDSVLLVVLWLVFALVNPWFEELYWRGLLLDAAGPWPKWLGAVYTTALFVLSHPLMWGVFSVASTSYHLYLYLSVMGIVWAVVYFKTGSLRWVILSHFIVDIGNLTVLTFLNKYIPPGMT
jgi:Predicted protease of the Abi (CAAX) family